MNESMNLSVDACYNFHSYVCGGWENQQNAGTYEWSFGIYDMLADKVKISIQNILTGIVPSFTNQNITDKVGIIFNACMAFENTEDRPDGLVNVLKSYGLGDWPMLENTTTNATDMLLKTGIIGLFDLFVQRDSQNLTSHVIQIPLLELMNKEFAKVNINLTKNDVVELHPLKYFEAVDEFLPTFDP
ncbi:hypothetical protein V5799_020240 [Amblyomma americanum]|uniref:Peptidase M13 N-terminal domain-containing protein n=1 Tax=Amblyomma americanum TaxID=6943 RepID=A0AAQ4EV06_AMBAM